MSHWETKAIEYCLPAVMVDIHVHVEWMRRSETWLLDKRHLFIILESLGRSTTRSLSRSRNDANPHDFVTFSPSPTPVIAESSRPFHGSKPSPSGGVTIRTL
jgi:hypothetical protein